MYQYSMLQWLLFFYFYCFFGWCFESTYVSIRQKKLVNRGFMRGPFLPLYGSGAIMMLVVAKPFEGNLVAVYIAGCIGATILEYVTGVTMEKMFKVRYWDYSKQRFNFQGQICLRSTLAWGGLTILMTGFAHKPIERAFLAIPEPVHSVITVLLTIYIVADFTLAFKAALDLRDFLVAMERAQHEMEILQKRMDVLIAIAGDELSARRQAAGESLSELKEAAGEQLVGMKEVAGEQLSELKEAAGEQISELKEVVGERVNAMRESSSLRYSALQNYLSEKILQIRELAAQSPDKYDEKKRIEIRELTGKIAALPRRMTIDRIARHMIRNNPDMTSAGYGNALEELKKMANDEAGKEM